MSWTKKEFIEMAFEELGLANYNFDLMPEQYQTGLRRLDAMMAVWNKKGIRIGYPLTSSPSESNLNDSSNIRDSANEAVYTNLALRLANPLGKMLSSDLKAIANSSYKALLRETAETIEMRYDTLPKGAGNKPWRENTYNTFINDKNDNLNAGPDNQIDFT